MKWPWWSSPSSLSIWVKLATWRSFLVDWPLVLTTHLLRRLWRQPLYPSNCAVESDVSHTCNGPSPGFSPPGTPFLSGHFPWPWWRLEVRRKANELWSQVLLSPGGKTLVRSGSQTCVLYTSSSSLCYTWVPMMMLRMSQRPPTQGGLSTSQGGWSRHVSGPVQCFSLF